MQQAERLFALVGKLPVGAPELNVPHLTLEILYLPLPRLACLKRALVEAAAALRPCRVPALGVHREASGATRIELELTPELVAIRRTLAGALVGVGAIPHPGPIESWLPHLSVIGQEEIGSRRAGLTPDPLVEGYSFPVESLILSRPGVMPGRFRESRPYRLGAGGIAGTRR